MGIMQQGLRAWFAAISTDDSDYPMFRGGGDLFAGWREGYGSNIHAIREHELFFLFRNKIKNGKAAKPVAINELVPIWGNIHAGDRFRHGRDFLQQITRGNFPDTNESISVGTKNSRKVRRGADCTENGPWRFIDGSKVESLRIDKMNISIF